MGRHLSGQKAMSQPVSDENGPSKIRTLPPFKAPNRKSSKILFIILHNSSFHKKLPRQSYKEMTSKFLSCKPKKP